MSREHELFIDLRSARQQLAAANEKGRHARKQIAKIMELIDRGETQQPLLDAIERNGQIAAGKPPDPPKEPESADERQRGPTEHGMSPLNRVTVKPPKRKPKTERADRREVVISPDGPIRQTETPEQLEARADNPGTPEEKPKPFTGHGTEPRRYPVHAAKTVSVGSKTVGGPERFRLERGEPIGFVIAPNPTEALKRAEEEFPDVANLIIGDVLPRPAVPAAPTPQINLGPEDIKAMAARLDESAAAGRLRKTFAAYVRDPVTGKPARGLGYIDAASKDKALALAAKRWPAIKPTEILISPPGWEQSPPPADSPERPKPLPPDPVQEMHDDHRRYQVEQEHGPGAPDPTVSQWAASVPVSGLKDAREFLGSFLATDEDDAYAVANARWPGYDGSLEVRRAGPPADSGVSRKDAKKDRKDAKKKINQPAGAKG